MNKNIAALGAFALASVAMGQSVHLKFEGDLTDAIGGPSAEGVTTGLASTTVDFETVTINGENTTAVRFNDGNQLAPGKGLKIYNPIGANGGGTKTNEYTLIFDVMLDGIDETYHGFIQTDASNSSDGDWFTREGSGGVPSGMLGGGISGDYQDDGNTNFMTVGEWHRVALVIKVGETDMYRTYVDGALQNIVQSPSGWTIDDRFSLDEFFYLNIDNSPEAYDTAYYADLALIDRALTDSEIARLGGPTAAGVPEPATMLALGAGLLALARKRRRK